MSKRRWFQVHLSTLLALVVVAGVLLGLNFKMRIDTMGSQCYGFPVDAWERPMMFRRLNAFSHPLWYPSGLAKNVGFAVASLIVVTTLCEWRIRRR